MTTLCDLRSSITHYRPSSALGAWPATVRVNRIVNVNTTCTSKCSVGGYPFIAASAKGSSYIGATSGVGGNGASSSQAADSKRSPSSNWVTLSLKRISPIYVSAQPEWGIPGTSWYVPPVPGYSGFAGTYQATDRIQFCDVYADSSNYFATHRGGSASAEGKAIFVISGKVSE